jgi:hypothetical protein
LVLDLSLSTPHQLTRRKELKYKVVLILFLLLFVWGIFIFEAVASNKTGASGLSFLKFGMGAKAVGMGEAFTAQSGEVISSW